MYSHCLQTIDNAIDLPVHPSIEGADDRRDSHRVRTVYRVVQVHASGDEGLARVRNLSDGGMKLSLGLHVNLGDKVDVALSDTTTLTGHVVWTNGDDCGLAFAEPIDSIAALRETAHEARAKDARAPRLKTGMSAVVSSERGLRPIKIRDVSQRGMKVAHDGSFAAGLAVKVRLSSGIERRGVVRWVRDNMAGLLLTEPFSVAELGAISAL